MPEKKKLRFRVIDSQPHINQIEEQAKPGVSESEKHRRSKSYRSGEPTPSSLPADEYVTPTGTVALLATASAPERDRVFDGWGTMGAAHFEGLGLNVWRAQLRTRKDALRLDLIDSIYSDRNGCLVVAERRSGAPF